MRKRLAAILLALCLLCIGAPSVAEGAIREDVPRSTLEQIPAYEGDQAEGNSVITYAVDLDGADDKELLEYREKCKDEFMELFKEHFRNLWD